MMKATFFYLVCFTIFIAQSPTHLMLARTAHTMNQDSYYISNINLSVSEFAYAVNDHGQISLTSSFYEKFLEVMSLGMKFRFFEEKFTNIALLTQYAPNSGAKEIGFVTTYGSQNILNAEMAYYSDEDSKNVNLRLQFGGLIFLNQSIGWITEYHIKSSKQFFSSNNLLNTGFRFQGDQLSLDVGTILKSDEDSIEFFPVIKLLYLF